ncbi:MAG: efflux RND transporter periplasmic adaptor subunit [Candidatus Thiodiazotropha sp.]
MNRLRPVSRISLLFLAGLSAAWLLNGCDRSAGAQAQAEPQKPPTAVEIASISPQTFDLKETYAGRVSAFRVAEIRPQVNGIILKRFFEEGAEVNTGDQLYQIDPAVYQAELNRAKSELAVAEANAESVRLKAKRYRELLASKSISQQDADDAEASWKQAKAQIQVALAAVKSAQISLDYTHITAPISGVISRSNVTEGALVSAQQQSPLATIRQLSPVYVDIQQPASALLRMRRQGESITHDVHLKLEDGTAYEETGQLQSFEANVDEGTGTVNVRALFDNAQQLLMPGMFVRADVVIEHFERAILVPQQGVTIKPNGKTTALLVGEENKVVTREIKVIKAVQDKWLVREGLYQGDRVIVKGLQKIQEGATVNPIDPSAAPVQE